MIQLHTRYCDEIPGRPLQLRISYRIADVRRFAEVHLDSDTPPDAFFADVRRSIDLMEAAYNRASRGC